MKAKPTTSSIRRGYAATAVLRFQLADTGRRVPLPFLARLKKFDSDLYLWWHPGIRVWILYRCTSRGCVPGEDLMVKEFVLLGPNGRPKDLGDWLFDVLRRWDKTHNGAVDPAVATKQYMKGLDQNEVDVQEKKDKDLDELVESFERDVDHYWGDAPHTECLSPEVKKKRLKSSV
jgi:hypothetical protein